jgi:hypothetical protein
MREAREKIGKFYFGAPKADRLKSLENYARSRIFPAGIIIYGPKFKMDSCVVRIREPTE